MIKAMNKKDLSERDICSKFIWPAVNGAGWYLQIQIREQVTFTEGRIIVRGKLRTRGEQKRVPVTSCTINPIFHLRSSKQKITSTARDQARSEPSTMLRQWSFRLCSVLAETRFKCTTAPIRLH